jgi:hypothetical protein
MIHSNVTFFGDSFGTRCININFRKIARKTLISKDSDVEPKVTIIENISVEVERKKEIYRVSKKRRVHCSLIYRRVLIYLYTKLNGCE